METLPETTSKNATKTYDSLGIEWECAWSTPPYAGASAPVEHRKKGDTQACKQDIRQRRPRHGVERAAAELELGTGTRQGALGVQSGGAQTLPKVAGQTLDHARQRMEKRETAKKTHDNLLNLIIELESIAQLCTCADCKAGKSALAEKRAHVPSNDETRDSSPVASTPASGPHPRSALRPSSSAAGSAVIGAARRKGKTTSTSVRGEAKPLTLPASSGASPSSATPIEKQRVRISSGTQFYSTIVHARLRQYDPPKERPAPRLAAASGPQTPMMTQRRYSYGELLKMQNGIGLSQRQVPLQAAESPAAETKKSRSQAPTVIKRHSSSGVHRASVAEDVNLSQNPAAEPRRGIPWHSTGDLRLRCQALQNLATRGDIQDPPEPRGIPWHSTGDLRLRRQALQNLAARGDIQDPPPQTPPP